MKNKGLGLGLLLAGLFVSSGAFAFGSTDNRDVRNCLNQSGDGSGFAYSYKNPGWNGQACTKPVRIWACKGTTCKANNKGSDATGVVRWNTTFRPGFTPRSSAGNWE